MIKATTRLLSEERLERALKLSETSLTFQRHRCWNMGDFSDLEVGARVEGVGKVGWWSNASNTELTGWRTKRSNGFSSCFWEIGGL